MRRLLAGWLFFSWFVTTPSYADVFDQMSHRYGVPVLVLRTIAEIESRKTPWTLNISGEPFYFSDKISAINFLHYAMASPWMVKCSGQRYMYPTQADAQATRGRCRGKIVLLKARRADIGIMQVNISYHGDKVPSVSRLFDVDYNVAYAAYHLSNLNRTYGSWEKAVKYYHSGIKVHQRNYWARFYPAYQREVAKANLAQN